ncbi:MAG: hypothetical protein Ct9H300mP7_6120 [Verrucomicrobiota bacterium]|nr:MAG: hypothetical protein Ct9H300mP7_6120 [Verrucomicrobiota bacterium]
MFRERWKNYPELDKPKPTSTALVVIWPKPKQPRIRRSKKIWSPKAKLKPQWRTSALRSDNLYSNDNGRSARSRRKKIRRAHLIQANASVRVGDNFPNCQWHQDQIKGKNKRIQRGQQPTAQFLPRTAFCLAKSRSRGLNWPVTPVPP